jgi:Flp pilus assembly protein TadD
MKTKLILLYSILQMAWIGTNAQNNKYNEAMAKWVNMLNDSLTTRENAEKMMNGFERIAKIEKDKWLPYYYAAHTSTLAASLEKNNDLANELTAKAESMLETLDKLSPKNPEVNILRAYIAYTQINTDFMAKGIKNSILAEKELNQALKLDKDNPRAYFLLGMGLYVKPDNFGGDKAKACQYFNKAAALDFPQTDPLSPVWQRRSIAKVLQLCAKNNLNN